MDSTIYKLKTEGRQERTKRKAGERSTFLLALSIVRMSHKRVIWEVDGYKSVPYPSQHVR